MSEKHLVCQGADCICQFGTTPDKIKVIAQSKHYINDESGSEKLIATDKDLGQPFQAKSFGSCKKMNNNPCKPAITKWSGFYDKVLLDDSAHVLLEDSKATCSVAGSECVSITFHGQTAAMTANNAANANADVQSQLNPLFNIKKVEEELSNIYLIETSAL
jgi:hypothetical protein